MQTLSAVRRIRRKPQPPARHAGRTQGQSEVCAASAGADGFLNHSFLPLYHKALKVPARENAELAYFQSAAELCRLHGFQQAGFSGLSYPRNILLSHRDITRKLNRQPYETELFITKEGGDDTIALATKQVYEVGQTLYYIPVIPLYKFLRQQKNKACGGLLLAVMSYLYKEAGIPYYRDESTFMYDEYEYNYEYYLECAENAGEDEFEEDIKEILTNRVCGDIMHRRISSGYHLDHIAETIAGFRPGNAFDEECLAAANDAYSLYRDFPNTSVFRRIEAPEDEEVETATPETYISFIGDDQGWIYDNIERSVNELLGNYAEMALPACVQIFDGSAAAVETLEFEYRLFDLITSLCNILYELP